MLSILLLPVAKVFAKYLVAAIAWTVQIDNYTQHRQRQCEDDALLVNQSQTHNVHL